MSVLKVLHVVSVDKDNYYLNNLVDYSDSNLIKHSFATLAAHSDFAKSLEKRGNQVFCLNAMGRMNYPRAAIQIAEILRKEDPDVVHTHLFDPSVIGLTVAKRQRRKTVLTRHHSDALHVIPSVVKRKFYLSLENYISRKSDHIIAPSRMVREVLVEKEGVLDKKVSIIPYGQTTERFDAVTPEKVEATRLELGMNDSVSLVCVSRLFYRKGHEYLFEAFSGLKREGLDAKIYLVGDGDYRTDLERLAASFGIADNVKFLGWRNDALAIMAAADVIVHPSLEDALSSAVIESLMLERPIVATDISGVRDSLDDGKYGKIVPPADTEGFRTGLKQVLDNLEDAKRRAREGRKYLLDYMDARRVANEHTMLYKRLLEN